MKYHDEYEQKTIKQKLESSIKKYIKLNRKKNSIESEMENLERDIQKYKLSYQEAV